MHKTAYFQSICPLCRSTVYVHLLRPLSEIVTDAALKEVFRRYLDLVIECPKCKWLGTMGGWDSHLDSLECMTRRSARRRNSRNLSQTSTNVEIGNLSESCCPSMIDESVKSHSLPGEEPMGRRSRQRRARGDAGDSERRDSTRVRRNRDSQMAQSSQLGEVIEDVEQRRTTGRSTRVSRKRSQFAQPAEELQNNNRQHNFSLNTSDSTSSTRPSTSEDVYQIIRRTRRTNSWHRIPQSSEGHILDAPSPYRVDFNPENSRPVTSQSTTEQPPIQHSLSSPEFISESSTEQLACWLLDHDPGMVIR